MYASFLALSDALHLGLSGSRLTELVPRQGAVDALEDRGIPCFGPTKAAAQLESSKAFSKEIMKKLNIPTAQYKVFDKEDRKSIIDYTNKGRAVIKVDGLAAVKGVYVCQTKMETIQALDKIWSGRFGKASDKIVKILEEIEIAEKLLLKRLNYNL